MNTGWQVDIQDHGMSVEVEYKKGAALLKGYASSYGNAWDVCLAVLADAGRADALFDEVVLNLALAAIPGGVGGVVGAMLKSAKKGDFIVDGVKDLVKDVLRRGGRTFLERNPQPIYRPVGDNPRTWQNDIESNLLGEMAFVQDIIRFYIHQVNVSNSSFELNFDPVVEIERYVRAGGQRVSQLPPADERAELIFEKFLWKSWIEKNRYFLQRLESRAGVGYQVGDRVPGEIDAMGGLPAYLAGKPIRARIYAVAAALGENGELWLQQWGAESLQALTAERDRLNVDAPGSSIKPVLDWVLR